MKKIVFIVMLLFTASALQAQQVRVRIGFPAGIRAGVPVPAPFRGAVWVDPEWRWQRGAYVSAPGYWARPHKHGATWVSGHWRNTRRSYVLVPGRWR